MIWGRLRAHRWQNLTPLVAEANAGKAVLLAPAAQCHGVAIVQKRAQCEFFSVFLSRAERSRFFLTLSAALSAAPAPSLGCATRKAACRQRWSSQFVRGECPINGEPGKAQRNARLIWKWNHTKLNGPLSGRSGHVTPNRSFTIAACCSKQPPKRSTFQLGSSMMVLPMPWSLA